jgi:hypothetical protein
MSLIFHPGDLAGSEFFGICLIAVVLPIAVIVVLLRVFLGRKDGR